MKSRISQLVAVLAIVAVAGAIFAGSALAQPEAPADGSQDGAAPGWMYGGRMGEMDQELWGQMIQRMNEIHGPELTGKMIQWMEEGNHCGGEGGFQGMMGNGFNGMMAWGSNGPGSMMGKILGQ